ncbi:MAG: efflux RND transporter periplasmic adaptor subunit [Candidatus Eisenbacteria bacterium]
MTTTTGPGSHGDSGDARAPDPARARRDLSALRMDRTAPKTRKRARWRAWVIAAVVLVAAFFGARQLPYFRPQVATTSVRVVTPAEASTVLTATGYTYARSKAAIGAKIIGRVMELAVDEGDTVRAGEIVARLDSRDLEAAVQQAEARLNEATARAADARRVKAREEQIFQAGASFQQALDEAATQLAIAEAQVQTAQAALDAARAQLAYATIRAPIDGVVIERNIEVGEMVAPGGFTSQQSSGAILRIADPTSLEVEADINESYIARLTRGQPAIIRIDAVPDAEYHGELRQIVPTADRQKAVVEVKVTIDDRDNRLVPDMSCSVTFVERDQEPAGTLAKPVVLIPESAVLQSGSAAFVFEVRGNRLRRVPVVLGERRDSDVVVTSGLSGGETIVREGVDGLRDGKAVRTKA